MGESVYGSNINDVLRLVRGMAHTGDGQLTIIARALVVGCRSCGIPKATAMGIISELFDQPVELVPLEPTTPRAGQEG